MSDSKDRDQEELPPVVLSAIKTKEGVSDSRALRDSNLGMIEEVAVHDWYSHRGPLNSVVSGSGVNHLRKSISMGTDTKLKFKTND